MVKLEKRLRRRIPIHVNITSRNETAFAERASSQEMSRLNKICGIPFMTLVSGGHHGRRRHQSPIQPITAAPRLHHWLEQLLRIWLLGLGFPNIITAQIKAYLRHACRPLHREPWSFPQQHLNFSLFNLFSSALLKTITALSTVCFAVALLLFSKSRGTNRWMRIGGGEDKGRARNRGINRSRCFQFRES